VQGEGADVQMKEGKDLIKNMIRRELKLYSRTDSA
jgi:hypothetical protein